MERSHAVDGTMNDADRPLPAPEPVGPWLRVPWRLLLPAALAFVLGWAASVAWSSTARFRVVEEIAGTVTVVNESGAKLCLESAGRPQRCGIVYQRFDAPALAVGDRVWVAVGLLRSDAGEEEIFLVESIK
jgi:hypothetical protein